MEIIKKEFNFQPYGNIPEGARLNLGCGRAQYTNLINIDNNTNLNPDINIDLFNFPYAIENNSVSFVLMHHFLEHVPKNIYFKFITELNRMCKDSAIIEIFSPYYTSIRAHQDPTHETPVSEATPVYFSSKWREDCFVEHYLDPKLDWELLFMDVSLIEPWNKKSDEARQFALQHYFNVASDIKIIMKVKKNNL